MVISQSPIKETLAERDRRTTRSSSTKFNNSLCFLCQTDDDTACNRHGQDQLMQMGSSGTGDRVNITLKNCVIDTVIARRLGVGIDDNVNMIAAKGGQYKTLQYHNNGVS